MNRNQRRLGRMPPRRKESEDKVKVFKKNGYEMEEVMSPKTKRNPFKTDKPMTNRCCYFSPDQKDFGQLTEIESRDKYQKLLIEQYGFDPIVPDTITQLKELRKMLCGSTHKVENCSQYVNLDCTVLLPAYVETSDGSQWQNIESVDDIDQYINEEKENAKLKPHILLTKNVHISEVPRVKIIAEKFSKLKKDNVELRKLDEKVVCIEYDVYDKARDLNLEHPVQKMRAFFSIKPINIDKIDDVTENVPKLPLNIKNEFNITDEDLKRLSEKEVEIIDGKIKENKSYLQDLRRVLRRKQVIYTKKQRSSLDLVSLYEMAKKEGISLDYDFSDTNLLSKAELQEIKNLILKNDTSIRGINRRKVRLNTSVNVNIDKNQIINAISESIVNEVMRETGSINKI